MATKCPNCDFDNPSDSELCKECGTSLVQEDEMPLDTETLQTPTKKTIEDVEVGDIIDDKYKIIEKLGSGGMGVVYKAEQLKPIERRVALKVIKLGMDTKEVVVRFDSEKQALAVMKHPNIAKVHDAGATEKGRPYFVMELVSGIPITEYCDKHKLTTKERLELFIPVCEAIQHAHQKGVIHRDLKPSNVLVEIQDDSPVPKIIDFGIARATERRLTERTLFTEQGQLMGTPEYMSPEQAEMSELDVDTRTDIYSLGVMLYELLVGALPFDSKALRSAGFSEIQRIIREEEPPRASTRLSGLGDTQTSIAEQRKTDVVSLHKQLKGDLDWITMKAMAKDRTRRYSTALDLAADVTRHLKKEPIIARPPSAVYNIGKFVRRHKVGVAAGAFVMLAILIGIAGTSLGMIRARRAEGVAKNEAAKAQAINEFLQETLGSADPRWGISRNATILEALDVALEKIDEFFSDQPEIKAAVQVTLGETYLNLGLIGKAESLQRSAWDINKSIFGYNHPSTIGIMQDLSYTLWAIGDQESAENLIHEAVSIGRNFKGKDRLVLAKGLSFLALIKGEEDLETEEKLIRESLSICQKILGKESQEALSLLHNLAFIAFKKGNYDDAESLFRENLSIEQKMLGEEHPDIAITMTNLANVLYEKADYEAAENLHRDAVAMEIKTLGDSHPSLAFKLWSLAKTLIARGKLKEAENIHKKALKTGLNDPRASGPNFDIESYTADRSSQYGSVLMEFNYYREAEKQLLEAFDTEMKRLGEDHRQTQRTVQRLVKLYEAWQKPEKAKKYLSILKDIELEK